MTCVVDKSRLCGLQLKSTNYLCTFNILEINMTNFFNASKFSALLTYQIVTKVLESFDLIDYHMSLVYENTTTIPFGNTNSNAHKYLRYTYTVWTTHGQGINIWIRTIAMIKPTNVSVSVLDGPTLVKLFDLRDLKSQGYKYQAGFRVTIGVMIINNIKQKVAKFLYKIYTFKPQVTDLENDPNVTKKISLNTARRSHNPIFYYAFLTVRASRSKFIQLRFANLRQFAGASHGCAEGGFVLSDFKDSHFWLTGPFCTQHGTEPLVNDIKTFQSTHNLITFFLYSYTFEMDVDIEFQHTECEGITNPCLRFCNPYRHLDLHKQNYKIESGASGNKCVVSIIITNGCVVVQNPPNQVSRCYLQILAHKGNVITSEFRTLNFIR